MLDDPWCIGIVTSLAASVLLLVILRLRSACSCSAVRRPLLRLLAVGLCDYFPNQRAAEKAMLRALERNHNVRIMAVRDWSFLPVLGDYTPFGDLIRRKGKTFRLLLLDPFTTGRDGGIRFVDHRKTELSDIPPTDATAQVMEDQIVMTLRFVEKLRREGVDCVVRLYNELPVFKLFIFDDCAFVGGFTKTSYGRNNPFYQCQRGKDLLFDLADRFFEHVWEHRSVAYEPDRAVPLGQEKI